MTPGVPGDRAGDPAERHRFDVLGSETVYDGAIVALRVDEVRMPGGVSARREVIEHFGAVVVVAVDDQDRLAMVRQYRHPLAERLWELPAGLLDIAGEDPVMAARRELAEETGLAAASWSALVDLAASPGFTDEVVRVFLAESLTDVERPEPEHEEADLEIVRVELDRAVQMVFSGEIVNASAAAGILALDAVRAGRARPRPADAPWSLVSRAFAERKAGCTDRRTADRPMADRPGTENARPGR